MGIIFKLRHPERRRGGKFTFSEKVEPSEVEGPSTYRRFIIAPNFIRDAKRPLTGLAHPCFRACRAFLFGPQGPSTQPRQDESVNQVFPLVLAQDDGAWKWGASVLLALFALAPLSAQTITPANFDAAAQYSRTHGGLALRVEQGGRLVDEAYYPGFSASVPHRIFSGTKSFVAVGALIAMQEGLLTFDEKASDTLTEWRHDRRQAITIAQLLNQTSGLDPDIGRVYCCRDQMAGPLDVRLIDPPGTRFHYGAINYQAFGELLTRKLRAKNESVEEFLKSKVFDPLDIDIDHWTRDDAGHVLLHSGISLTPEQWEKFGAFINRGLQGKTISLVSNQALARLFVGTHANPAYGLGFWLNRPPPEPRLQSIKKLQLAIDGDQLYPDGPRDLVACIGSEKQRLYMIPSLDLVIVRFGQETAFSDGDFLSRLLTGKPHPDAHTH